MLIVTKAGFHALLRQLTGLSYYFFVAAGEVADTNR
jgi:hypothetical protein